MRFKYQGKWWYRFVLLQVLVRKQVESVVYSSTKIVGQLQVEIFKLWIQTHPMISWMLTTQPTPTPYPSQPSLPPSSHLSTQYFKPSPWCFYVGLDNVGEVKALLCELYLTSHLCLPFQVWKTTFALSILQMQKKKKNN